MTAGQSGGPQCEVPAPKTEPAPSSATTRESESSAYACQVCGTTTTERVTAPVCPRCDRYLGGVR